MNLLSSYGVMTQFPYQLTLRRILIEESELEIVAILGAAALFCDAVA